MNIARQIGEEIAQLRLGIEDGIEFDESTLPYGPIFLYARQTIRPDILKLTECI